MNENSPSRTIKAWLTEAEQLLREAGIPSPKLDAELLISHTLREPRTWVHAHGDDILEDRHREIARARLDLRLDRVPIAYIIGHKEFYGYSFKVTTATLIPRPESERIIELLDRVMSSFANTHSKRLTHLVDVGTGSGALGIVAKIKHPELDVTLLDISRYALSVAERNARDHHVDVTILESNLLERYPYAADVIVANLPYVDPSWERSPETRHEPASALFAENNGLALIEELIQQTKTRLSRGGYLILEADPEQHEAIKKEATTCGLICVEIRDYALLFEKLK